MDNQFQDQPESPNWGTPAKVVVAVLMLLLSGMVAYRFQSLIAQLVVAAMIAYIMNPLIAFVNKRTTVSRGVVTLVSYLLLAVLVGWTLVSLGVAAFQQVSNLLELLNRLTKENRSLRAQQELLATERAGLLEKHDQVRNRVDAIVTRLKSMETGA